MPYKKNYRRNNRRKRTYRRRHTTRRVSRPMRINSKVHAFTRTTSGAITVDATLGYQGAFTFKLDDLPNYTEFTNLYDQYQICAIRMEFVPKYTAVNQMNVTNTGTFLLGSLHTVVDYDDSTAPTSASELFQYGNYKRTRLTSKHVRYLKPAWLAQTYETALTTGYSPQWKRWLSTNDANIPHYCVKIYGDQLLTDGSTLDLSFDFDVYVKYYIRMRSVK